uniref:Putative secreted protein n=1 Tax=Anopheles darlingi TaxID=43151 RepID=A0A2M4D3E9_ANODA
MWTLVVPLAHTLAHMTSQVLAQIVDACENLTAHVTRQRFLSLGATVRELQVPIEMIATRKVLTAGDAGERFTLVVRLYMLIQDTLGATLGITVGASVRLRCGVDRADVTMEILVRLKGFGAEPTPDMPDVSRAYVLATAVARIFWVRIAVLAELLARVSIFGGFALLLDHVLYFVQYSRAYRFVFLQGLCCFKGRLASTTAPAALQFQPHPTVGRRYQLRFRIEPIRESLLGVRVDLLLHGHYIDIVFSVHPHLHQNFLLFLLHLRSRSSRSTEGHS